MRIIGSPRKKIKDVLYGISKDLKRNQRKRSKKTQQTNYGKLSEFYK